MSVFGLYLRIRTAYSAKDVTCTKIASDSVVCMDVVFQPVFHIFGKVFSSLTVFSSQYSDIFQLEYKFQLNANVVQNLKPTMSLNGRTSPPGSCLQLCRYQHPDSSAIIAIRGSVLFCGLIAL